MDLIKFREEIALAHELLSQKRRLVAELRKTRQQSQNAIQESYKIVAKAKAVTYRYHCSER